MLKNEKNELKEAFTIRIPKSLLQSLDNVGSELNLKTATIARNYLQLSESVIVQPSMDIFTMDNHPLALFPREILKELFVGSSEERQLDIGDKLAQIININCQLTNITDINDKIHYLKSLGWMEIKTITGYWGFSSKIFSVMIMNSLLYRIINPKKKYQIKWSNATINSYIDFSDGDLTKEGKKKESKGLHADITQYKNELYGIKENYSPTCRYFCYETLKITN